MNIEDQLVQLLSDLSLVITETSVILGALTILLVGIISKKSWLIKGTFLTTLIIALFVIQSESGQGLILHKSLTLNRWNYDFDRLFIITSGLVILFPRKAHVTEFYFLILSLLVGCLFMVKANSLLLVYLSIELVSYISYTLTALALKKDSNEASIKYLLFGSISSAFLLIGLGLIYGATGAFYLSDFNNLLFDSLLSQVGLLFALLGVFFKASIFPFHIWTPAAYQTAPVDAVAIFSILPKLAGLMLMTNFFVAFELVETFWITKLILLLGMATMVVGTFGALGQKNTRRMIAFGSIAHSGFLFAFVVGPAANDLLFFYAVIYAIMSIGCFYLIHHFESNTIFNNSEYGELDGQAILLVTFSLILISLTGIPPLAGFTAKFFLFSYLWDWFQAIKSPFILAYLLISVFTTVVALFYYLRIPYFYFIKEDKVKKEAKSIEITALTKIIATLFGLTLLLLFFVPKLVV